MQIRTPGAPLSSVYLNILQARPAAAAPAAAGKPAEEPPATGDKPAAATPRPYLARGSLIDIIA